MPKNITIFTTNTCAYCGMMKKWLTNKGYPYEEVNVDQNPDRREEAYKLSGALTVPVTIVTRQDNSRVVVTGFNLSRLAPALA